MIDLALDTETCLITPAIQAPPLVCMSLSTGDLFHRTEIVKDGLGDLRPILLAPDIRIIGHGIAYDMCVFMAHSEEWWPLIFDAYDQDRVTCTEVRQKLSDIAGGVYRGFDDCEDGHRVKVTYDLAALSVRLLNRKLAKKDTYRLRYGELIDVPIEQWPEDAKSYAITDSTVTKEVFDVQEQNAEYLHDQYRQTRSDFWLRLMSVWGIYTHPQRVRELAARIQGDYDKIADDLRASGLLRPDKVAKRDLPERVTKSGKIKPAVRKGQAIPGSRNTKLAQARITSAYGAWGSDDVPLTDGGQPSLNKRVCKESGDPILVQYAELSHLKKVLSEDIPLLMRGTTIPIHAHFEVLLETGRTASKPNIQNRARKGGIRECFVPPPGMVFISADYGQLELYTLAEVCYQEFGYSSLGDALNAGRDPHLEIAADILDTPYADLERIKKTLPKSDPISEWMKDGRQTGKVANFGFPGGLGAKAFTEFALDQYDVRLTEDRARYLKSLWLAKWVEMKDYLAWVGRVIDTPHAMIEHHFVKRFQGGMGYCDACNSFFQGLGSDIAKAAGWLIAKACYVEVDSPLFGYRKNDFVHDDFWLSGPEDTAHEAAIELGRLMVEASKPFLPHLTIKAEPQVSRCMSSNAEPIYKDGRLIPWDIS